MTTSIEERVAAVERQIDLSTRVAALEAVRSAPLATPSRWWDRVTITAVAALLAAILPLATCIDGHYAKEREEARFRLEQQNSIRQDYLTRLFSPGVKPTDRVALLALLRKYPYDSVFQAWADEQYSAATEDVDSLKRRIAASDSTTTALQDSLVSIHRTIDGSVADKARLTEIATRLRLQLDSATRSRRLAEAMLGRNTPEGALVITSGWPALVSIRPNGSNGNWESIGGTPLLRFVEPGSYEIECLFRHAGTEVTETTAAVALPMTPEVVECPAP
ncbi:MAG TPA: hypothetical protein VF041_11350 [Gemmatimonadaceae bacterium]